VTKSLAVFVVVLAAVAGGCGGAEDPRDPLWAYISPVIIQPNCATSSCHSQGSAVAGLDLSTADAGYKNLLQQHLGLRGQQPPPARRLLVIPGNPDESRVVNMLRADGADRMPPDRPLARADIQLIERWILDGAQR
jgi:hypothetical protein